MKIIRMSEIEGRVNPRGVVAKELINHEHVKVMNLVLKPGDSIPEHAVNVDVFFYVVKGKGTLKIGDEKAAVAETDIVLCPPKTPMSVYADQGEEFVILNVKTPRP